MGNAAFRIASLAVMASLCLGAGASQAAPVEAAFEHIGVRVSDIDRSIRFYEDNFGFRLGRRGDFLGPDPVKPEEATESAAFLVLGDMTLELNQTRRPRTEPAEIRRRNLAGDIHIGLIMKDVRAVYPQLKAQGVEFLGPPIYKKRNNTWYAHALDPDGTRLELQEHHAVERAK